MAEELHEHGTRCGKNRIARLMKDNGFEQNEEEVQKDHELA